MYGPWQKWRPWLLGLAVYAVVLAVIVGIRAAETRKQGTLDFRDFWMTARDFRATGVIRTDLGVHNYLPFFTIFMLPWSLVPLRVAAVLFTLLSVGLFGLTVYLVNRLLSDLPGRGPRSAVLVGAALALPYVHSCAVLGQVGLLVLFLIVATWFLVERGREWEAGIALGLAALIKLMPLALLPYFLLQRRWRPAIAAAGVFLVLGAGLPLAALGPARAAEQHAEFRRGALVGHAARTTILAEKPRKAKYSNNALPIVLRRLLSPVNADPQENHPGFRVNFAELPRAAIWWSYILLLATILATSAALTLRRPATWPPDSPPGARRVRAQFGIWCCVMLLASPLLWTHYLPLVFWPLALLADRLERIFRVRKRVLGVAGAALAVWLIGAVLLAWPAARAAGAQLVSVLALWVALTVIVARRSD